MDMTKKWTTPVREWADCISQLILQFGDRMEVAASALWPVAGDHMKRPFTQNNLRS